MEYFSITTDMWSSGTKIEARLINLVLNRNVQLDGVPGKKCSNDCWSKRKLCIKAVYSCYLESTFYDQLLHLSILQEKIITKGKHIARRIDQHRYSMSFLC